MEHEYMRTHYGEKYWDKLCGKPMPEESTPPIWKENYLLQQQYIEELERELNATNESFRKLNIHALDLAARIKRLEDAGDIMEWWCTDPQSIREWHEAKEVKL